MSRQLAYIAGPMRGYPMWNSAAFDRAKEKLRKAGWNPVSPIDLDRAAGMDLTNDSIELTREDLTDCIVRDTHALVVCDAVVLLPGWEKSKGARVEIALAKFLDIPVLDIETMKPVDTSEALPWLN